MAVNAFNSSVKITGYFQFHRDFDLETDVNVKSATQLSVSRPYCCLKTCMYLIQGQKHMSSCSLLRRTLSHIIYRIMDAYAKHKCIAKVFC
jgi:hypothetical protein